jgi:CheY-like chemotaxis protein
LWGRGEKADMSDSENTADAVKCEKNRVLIVDDESAILDIFKRILEYGIPDCKIDLAINGAEGVATFKETHPKVLLMDLHMPVLDGEAAFVQINDICTENNWEMPSVVFCTGYDPSHELQNTIEGNPLHCVLRKPVSNDKLTETIKRHLAL